MQAFLATNEIIWNLFSAALIGAVAGGIVAGLLIWRMRKKLAKDQQSHDQQRDKLLKEFEQDCNKRQSAWILFQELEAFAGCILEADQYASSILAVQLKTENAPSSVLFFGNLIDKIEILWQRSSRLLSNSAAVRIRNIATLMNQYKQTATRCYQIVASAHPQFAGPAAAQAIVIERLEKKCALLQQQWNAEWTQLKNQMKLLQREILRH